jgi:DNA-binding Lrp family transcriptional regulator
VIALSELPALDEAAYRALLRTPRLPAAELAARLTVAPAELEQAMTRLSRAGLVSRRGGAWRPVRPDRALAAALEAEEDAVEQRRREVVDARRELSRLVEDYLSGRAGSGDVEVEVLHGAQVRVRLDQLMAGVRTELLTLSSDVSEADEASVEAWRAQDLPLLARGVVSRSIAPPELRDHPVIWAYTEEVWRAGEQVRIADGLPPRMVVRDREVALLPVRRDDPGAGVLVVWSASVVAALVALFEEVWQRARPAFGPVAPQHAHDPRLLALLAGGAKDESIARHLGRGLRTVRREVAALLDDLGAPTRFAAGVEAARRGWL